MTELKKILKAIEAKEARRKEILDAFHRVFFVVPSSREAWLNRAVVLNGVGFAMGRKKVVGTTSGAEIREALLTLGIKPTFSRGKPRYMGLAFRPEMKHLHLSLEMTKLRYTNRAYREKYRSLLELSSSSK